jgi:hypothetical protein
MRKYTKDIELKMKMIYESFTESARRRYAAIEALKLGFGGKKYICEVLCCDYSVIENGILELNSGKLKIEKERNAGAGRKRTLDKNPEIESVFIDVIKNYTAGNPMNDKKWTNLNMREISEILKKKGYDVSEYIVDQMLENNGYKKIQAFKCETYKDVEGRDEQFERIDQLKKEFIENPNNPIISVDVKKKNK